MGRLRNSETVNVLRTLRGLTLPPPLVSARWGTLCIGDKGGCAMACTLIGAGAVGAFLALKYSLNSKCPETREIPSDECSAIPFNEEDLNVPGLQNSGNNCFLNVILQALLSMVNLSRSLSNNLVVFAIIRDSFIGLMQALASSEAFVSFMATCADVTSKAEIRSSVTHDSGPISMPLAVSVSSLMKELSILGKARRTSSPQRVMVALRSYVKHFDLASQQDAAEALVHLASAVQEECDNYIQWLRPTLHSFATASLNLGKGFLSTCESGLCIMRQGGDQLLKSWRSHLHWPLEGTLASSLSCQRCSHNYTTQIQFFNDISLSPLQDKEGNIIEGCTLENCLERFTGPEWVESVKCSNCSHEAAVFSMLSVLQNSRSSASRDLQNEERIQYNLMGVGECGFDEDCGCEALTKQQGGIWRDVYAKASKQLKIGRCPKVLCFQIQRVVMSVDGGLKKLTGQVSFPKVLDLFPFTMAAESSSGKRDYSTTQRYKGSLLPKTLNLRGDRPIEEDLCDVGQALLLETELLCKVLADSDQQRRSDTPEIMVLPQEEHDSKHHQVPVEDQNSVSLLSKDSGSFLTYLPSASSIRSPYVPRWFPPQLQSFSQFSPHHGQQFYLPTTDKSTKRAPSRGSSYSKRLLYELVSVIVHQGGPQSGHYIVYRKIPLPNYNSISAVKDIPFLWRPTVEQRSENKVEMCTSSVNNGAQGVSTRSETFLKETQPTDERQRDTIKMCVSDSDQAIFMPLGTDVDLTQPVDEQRQENKIGMPRGSLDAGYEAVSMEPWIDLHAPQSTGEQRGDKLDMCLGDLNLGVKMWPGADLNQAQPTYDKNQKGKVETCIGSVSSVDETASLQPGGDVDRTQLGVCQSLGASSSIHKVCSGGTSVPVVHCQSSEDQEPLGSTRIIDDTVIHNILSVQEISCNMSQETKHCSERGDTRENLAALWFRVSDTHVDRVQEQEVFSSPASLLFYEQL